MRILLVGAGGVGSAIARIAARRSFAELLVADYDAARATRAAGQEFTAVQLDARDEQAVAELLTSQRCDVLLNATDPRFVMPLFRAALRGGHPLPGHGHVAVAAAPGRAPPPDRGQARRPAVRAGR